MSTLGQPHLEPAWKQEVNRRIAAHKNRKNGVADENAPAQTAGTANSRAAEAAARVAARYAKAPTYSQMQAEEARMAVRAAEIATKVALEAQAAAESALQEMHAAAVEQPMRGPAVVESIVREPRVQESAVAVAEPVIEFEPAMEAELEPVFFVEEREPEAVVLDPSVLDSFELESVAVAAVEEPPAIPPVVTHETIDGRDFDLRWEPDLPVHVMERRPAAPRVQDEFELNTEDWWTPAEMRSEPLQVDSQTSPANLIEFPRELVAPRKMRPRLAEPASAEPEKQLSIFEVDPGNVPAEPLMAEQASVAETPQWTAPAYAGPEWSGMELDAHPEQARMYAPVVDEHKSTVDLAPLGLRLLATTVDGALIFGVFFALALWASARMQQVPALKTAEAMAAAGLLVTGLLYHAVFFGLGSTTFGMKYAGIALSTFDDEVPNREQLWKRFGAMVLSMLPMGLGLVWSVFDDDHLSWHDRFSGTYLRKKYS